MYSTSAYTDGEIANWLNSQHLYTTKGRGFSKDSVREVLQNIFYTGMVLYRGARETCTGTSYRKMKGTLSKGLHEPAIDGELFYKCQKLRKNLTLEKNSKQQTKRVYLLAGTIKCDYCERHLRAQSAASGARYYRDTSISRGFNDCIVDKDSKKSVNAEEVEKQLESIINLLVLPESWKKELEEIFVSNSIIIENVETKKERIEKQIERTIENYEEGYYKDKLIYKQKIQKLMDQLSELEIPSNHEVQNAAEIILSIKEIWAIASDEEKVKLIKMIFKDVGVSIKTGKIAWFSPQYGFEPLFKLIPNIVVEKENRYKLLDVDNEMH